MPDTKTILCPNCGHPYPIPQTACPACGHANPLSASPPPAEAASPPRRRFGCFRILLFFLLILGGIVLGVYQGLQERTARRQAEVEKHYQQALTYAENDNIELAIAELNQTLTLNPAHREARDLLSRLKEEEAQQQSRTPTPLPLLTTESAQEAADQLYQQVQDLTLQGDWEAAINLLQQIRTLAPTYQPTLISDALYNANYELGLRLASEGRFADALHAFDEALVERPNDPAVTAEWEKVSLYLSLKENAPDTYEDNIVILTRLYNLDPAFADVKERLYSTYRAYGDYLAGQEAWCLAGPRYRSAAEITPGDEIDALARAAELKCKIAQQPTPTPTTPPLTAETPLTAAATLTATAIATDVTGVAGGSGHLYFDRFNPASNLWEIIALAPASGEETILLSNGVQPAVSPDGAVLVYVSLLPDSAGLHAFSLVTGEDLRLTTYAEDVLPRWGGGAQEFVFASQRSGDRRWQVFIGFADGKGEAVPVSDGRTAALSAQNDFIVYQGTDPQGNNPGLYSIPRAGGEPLRLTDHESDRSPALSPDDRVAFMTARNGSWDIWIVPLSGETPAAPLIASPANDGLPVWSPDGAQVAFVSDRDGSWGVYIAGADGQSPVRVADWGSNRPDWLLGQLSWGP